MKIRAGAAVAAVGRWVPALQARLVRDLADVFAGIRVVTTPIGILGESRYRPYYAAEGSRRGSPESDGSMTWS